jgi:hypothetical protein
MLVWNSYGFNKKHAETFYSELVFSHPVGSAGHVVHSGASTSQNANAVIFMLRWADAVSINSARGHVTPNLCFWIRWDLWVT